MAPASQEQNGVHGGKPLKHAARALARFGCLLCRSHAAEHLGIQRFDPLLAWLV